MGILSRIKGVFHGGTIEKAATARRRFDAAAVNRLTAGWLAEANAIDNELRSDLDRLRARARDLANNNEYVKKWLKMVVNNIAGPNGFTLQARAEDNGVQDGLANTAIERAFADWARRCDVTGQLTFTDLLHAMCRAVARDGEFILRKITGVAAGNPEGYLLQLIDIDRLDTAYNVAAVTGRNAVVMGIEIDAYRRPVAYHLFTSHPNGNGQRLRERVPASEIIHRFVVERPEQTRGYPWCHAVIKSIHDLGEYNKSAMIAARKGADTLGFFVSPNGEPPPMDGDEDGEPITVSVPGQYDTLPEGYDFRAYESQYPSATYGEFVKAHLRRIATGLGVSYNTLAEDLEGVNYSSIRSGVINERDDWMVQQNWLINTTLTPLFEEWLRWSLMLGAIRLPNGSALPLAKFDKFKAHTWIPRRWQWVDPLKDIEAARLAIQTGVTSPQAVAAQMGNDVDDVLADLARFEQSVTAAGVSAISITQSPTATPTAAPADPAQTKAHRMNDDLMIQAIRAMAERPDPKVELGKMFEGAVLNITRTENIQPPVIENNITVSPTPITNIVEVAPTPVNVEAQFEATVQPAEVTLNLPPRRTDSSVVRNDKGEIVATTTIERDA